MAFAAVAALAALSALALGLLAARRSRLRADRRFEAVLGELDRHMGAISTSLQRVVERSSAARARSVEELELTIDLGELLRRIAAEAAARTGAEAALVQVIGPAGAPMSATFGTGERAEILESPLVENASAFRAVTINWTYRPGAQRAAGRELSSALVVPLVEGSTQTGSLAVYVPAHGAFGPGHVQALERLAEEAAPAIASARRYSDTQLALTDPETGLRNEAGYRTELDRAVAHAAERPEPLSLLALSHAAGGAGNGESLRDLSRLLVRLIRAGDVVCRRSPSSLGVILPGTTGESARSFHLRVLDAASQAALLRPATYAAGLAEWRPGESAEGLDARADAAVGASRLDAVELRAGGAPAREHGAVDRRDVLRDQLVREIARARQLARPLALLVLDVADELRRIGAEQGSAAAAHARAAVEARVVGNVRNGTVSCWIGDEALAVLLHGSTAADAENVLAALQAAEPASPQLDWEAVSAGITELAWGDDAASVLNRAQHALWRAKRAGRGTVVVATAADDARS
jgi:GGDEF domain-containing protein